MLYLASCNNTVFIETWSRGCDKKQEVSDHYHRDICKLAGGVLLPHVSKEMWKETRCRQGLYGKYHLQGLWTIFSPLHPPTKAQGSEVWSTQQTSAYIKKQIDELLGAELLFLTVLYLPLGIRTFIFTHFSVTSLAFCLHFIVRW